MTSATTAALDPHPIIPKPAIVRSIEPVAPGVSTYWIEFVEPSDREAYRIAPGQFNMVYLPGLGEVAISVSGFDGERGLVGHTIRAVGRVTRAMESLVPGSVVGLRGPYGVGWPMESAAGRDVLVVAGGLGLVPLRMALRALLEDRGRYGRLTLVYGARTPGDLLFRDEHEAWASRGLEVVVTVDSADITWRGIVGVVPHAMRRLQPRPEHSLMMTCGPEVMMRFAIAGARAAGIADVDLFLSLERNMQCAVGLCGRCQLGPEFLCKDGPVIPYPRVARFLGHPHF